MSPVKKSSSLTEPGSKENFYIIGIGASAGGLEAIHDLFDTIPENSGYAFIVVQHLSPDHKSLMPTLITRHTKMRVLDAVENLLILPDHIYFIPNDKLMTIRGGKLMLTQKSYSKEPNRAIDIFFNSLAEDKGENAIGIILSGTGTDGTEGIASIKKYGGITVVQDPPSAKFDGMPNSAIASGNADIICSPEAMMEEINTYVNEPRIARLILDSFTEEDEEILQQIFSLLIEHTTFDFSMYKRPTIIRRIIRRMLFNKINKLKKYLIFLQENHDEIIALGKEFLIGVTRFFRDKEAFEFLQNKIVPEIVEAKLKTKEGIKLWSAGCSTGEEAYSIAILFKEHLQRIGKQMDIKIFATDIDKAAIDIASKGYYSLSITNDVSPERLERYFVLENGRYHIIPEIRKMVIFAPHNLPKDPPFSKMDLVSCRNLLIYFTPMLQKKALNAIHFSLNIGGYLFLGPSESLGELSDALVEIDKKNKIYQNRSATKVKYQDSFVSPDLRQNPQIPDRYSYPYKSKNPKDLYTDTLFDAAFEEFRYAGVYVSLDFQVIEARGEIRNFMELPDKRFDLNILKMVDENLSLSLAAGLRKAIKEGEKVSLKGLKSSIGNQIKVVDLLIRPFLAENKFDKKCLLILFSESNIGVEEHQKISKSNLSSEGRKQFEELERELKETRENLQAAMEEIETSNEELQSSNEELISSNEELQSTNEELQSLNEELHSVNTEHQFKIKELIELNEDLTNYFRSTDIGQIFLDGDLRIRKFTPAVKQQINLIDGDIGRPINHLSNNIKYPGLLQDIRKVMDSSQQIEREVEILNGKYYQMKISPYEKQDKTIDGVVITFMDISILKNINAELEKRVEARTEELTSAIDDLKRAKEQLSLINLELSDKNEKLLVTNSDLDNFIYTASHDLKAPVSNIEGLINTLEHTSLRDEEDIKYILGLIKESIRRFQETIQDLTQIVKIQRSSEEDVNEIDIPEIVNDAKLSIREMIDHSKARIKMDFENDAIIKFSRKNFRSIIYNLISNAVKYRSPDRVPEIHIRTEKHNGFVRLCVKDNGLGFKSDQKEKMFTMFKRFHDHVEGTGVGLYIVKRIIDNAGGKIEVESKEGEGTEFRIYFKSSNRVFAKT
jgi:two-component system, chemotaxis family, CheB/CheR fusion protein